MGLHNDRLKRIRATVFRENILKYAEGVRHFRLCPECGRSRMLDTAVYGQDCNICTNGNGRTSCVGVRHLLAGDRRRITPERGCAA